MKGQTALNKKMERFHYDCETKSCQA